MPVVAHQAIAQQTHRKTGQPFGENRFKRRKIAALLENAQTAIRTIQDVINNITQIFTLATRHINQFKKQSSFVYR